MQREFRRRPTRIRVLVYGAGNAGETIVREMRRNHSYGRQPVGFVDDEPARTGRRIDGLRVMGTGGDLPAIMARCTPDEVLIAIPWAESSTLRRIVRSLEPYRVAIRTLAHPRELKDRASDTGRIRSLAIEDLLSRAPVGLDPAPLSRLISRTCVLVTGAGGSIGSELCRQIMMLEPASLVLLDRYENGLHALATDLADHGGGAVVESVIADVTDVKRLDAVFSRHRPDIVFHAAAHKHVPLMELKSLRGGQEQT